MLDRAVERARLEVPEELSEAEAWVQAHPRSWQPAVALGDVLYKMGKPKRALAAYERALARYPSQPEARIGRMKSSRALWARGGLDLARASVVSGVDDARVIVAAAELLDAVGASEEAVEALEAAWTTMPERILRRDRLRRGLTVDD